jgi:hypothetical protein
VNDIWVLARAAGPGIITSDSDAASGVSAGSSYRHTPARLPLKASLVPDRLTVQNYKCGLCSDDITALDEN